MKAYHITGVRENYFVIHRDSFLRPRSELRPFGEQVGGLLQTG